MTHVNSLVLEPAFGLIRTFVLFALIRGLIILCWASAEP